jgi:hypothetical protein
MNQTKTKFRYIYAGIMLAAVLAAAAGCGGEIFPKPQEDTSGMIGYNEGEMVRVRVTMPKSAALSVVTEDVEKYVNFWEVVFKSADATPKYYRGTGIPAARNDIDVTVPIGNGYTVLLMGGDMETKTLLAAGSVSNQDIVRGIQNTVRINLTKVALQWTGVAAAAAATEEEATEATCKPPSMPCKPPSKQPKTPSKKPKKQTMMVNMRQWQLIMRQQPPMTTSIAP